MNIAKHQKIAAPTVIHIKPTKLNLDQFVAELQLANGRDEIWSVMEKHVSSVGFEYLIYVNMRSGSRSQEEFAISNFPKWWQELYLSDPLIKEDIVFKYCDDLKPKLVDLDENYCDFAFNAALKERTLSMREVGFRNGFVSPNSTKYDDRVSGWCFGSSMDKAEFVKTYARFAVTLRLLGLCVHERLEASRKEVIDYSTCNTGLSAREQECLTYLAKGKRSPNIAKMMGISLSTVEFHIKGIKRKLNAATREEAVAKAITYGHIAYSS